MVYFSFVLSLFLFFFFVALPHGSLLPLVIFASAVFLPAARITASAHHLVVVVFFAAAAVFVFFIDASHTQWHVTVTIAKFESASSFSFLGLRFYSFCFNLSSPSRLIKTGKSPSTCLSLCLPPPSLIHLPSSWVLCVAVHIGLLIVFPSPLRLCPTSRLFRVVATSFLPTIFPFVLRVQIRCLEI